MQQQQSGLIKEIGIKIIIVHSEMKHISKTMLGVIKNYCFCIRKIPLHATSTQDTIQNTRCITWCLLNVNNICDLLRYA